MQEDKDFKELLLKGGLEKASPVFTSNVMKGIKMMRISKSIYEPLVSEKWIRIYQITFFTVLGLLGLLSLLIKFSELSVTINLQIPGAYIKYSDRIIIYIISFWGLVFLARKLDKQTVRSL